MYKIVTDKLKSAVMEDSENAGLAVQYKLGEFVSAPKIALEKGYGLCVFPTLRDVRRSCFAGKIFEVEVIGQLPALPPYCDALSVTLMDIVKGVADESVIGWSGNTIMVESVKLLREVPQND